MSLLKRYKNIKAEECIHKYRALHITASKRKNPQLGFFPNFSPSSTPQNFVYSDMLSEILTNFKRVGNARKSFHKLWSKTTKRKEYC